MTTYTLRQAEFYFEGQIVGVSIPFVIGGGEQPPISVTAIPASGYAAAAVKCAAIRRLSS